MPIYSLKNKLYYGSMRLNSTFVPFNNTPPVTSGLTHWYDGSDSTTMTVSSGNISQWNNKSPASGGPNMTQGTGSRQPNLETFVQNGRSAVRFMDANEDNLFSSTQPTTGTSAFTLCLAAGAVTYSVGQVAVSWGNFNAVGAGWSQSYNNGFLEGGYAGNVDTEGIKSTTSTYSGWFTQVLTASNTSVQGWMQSEAKKTKTTSPVNISARNEFFLGWLGDPWYSTYGFNGHIGDVLIYNRVLTDTEATTMRDWLQQKWSIG